MVYQKDGDGGLLRLNTTNWTAARRASTVSCRRWRYPRCLQKGSPTKLELLATLGRQTAGVPARFLALLQRVRVDRVEPSSDAEADKGDAQADYAVRR